jgi:hypothetical protein
MERILLTSDGSGARTAASVARHLDLVVREPGCSR